MQLLSASWSGDCKVQEIWDSTCVISARAGWVLPVFPVIGEHGEHDVWNDFAIVRRQNFTENKPFH